MLSRGPGYGALRVVRQYVLETLKLAGVNGGVASVTHDRSRGCNKSGLVRLTPPPPMQACFIIFSFIIISINIMLNSTRYYFVLGEGGGALFLDFQTTVEWRQKTGTGTPGA